MGLYFFAVAFESFTDGLMIGTGVLIAITLGLLLSLGQATADIPMGFVNISSFKEKRFLLTTTKNLVIKKKILFKEPN